MFGSKCLQSVQTSVVFDSMKQATAGRDGRDSVRRHDPDTAEPNDLREK